MALFDSIPALLTNLKIQKLVYGSIIPLLVQCSWAERCWRARCESNCCNVSPFNTCVYMGTINKINDPFSYYKTFSLLRWRRRKEKWANQQKDNSMKPVSSKREDEMLICLELEISRVETVCFLVDILSWSLHLRVASPGKKVLRPAVVVDSWHMCSLRGRLRGSIDETVGPPRTQHVWAVSCQPAGWSRALRKSLFSRIWKPCGLRVGLLLLMHQLSPFPLNSKEFLQTLTKKYWE